MSARAVQLVNRTLLLTAAATNVLLCQLVLPQSLLAGLRVCERSRCAILGVVLVRLGILKLHGRAFASCSNSSRRWCA